MAKVSWVDRWHALREIGNPVYARGSRHGPIGFKQRVASEFAYRVGKEGFGITDDSGNLIPKGTPAYEAAKQRDRETALGVVRGDRPRMMGSISGVLDQ